TPDEAPIWDQFSTTVYAPARISGETPITLLFSFDPRLDEAERAVDGVRRSLPALRSAKAEESERRLERGRLSVDKADADLAYAQILSRFDDCLVARDLPIPGESQNDSGEGETGMSAILAGNRYFLDAWKRDENIA